MGIFDNAKKGDEILNDDRDFSTLFAYESIETIEVWDNTMLNTYRQCPRKFYWQIIRGFVPRRKSPALSFGTAWHLFLENFLKGMDWKEALAIAIENFSSEEQDTKRNLATLTDLAQKYVEQFGHSEYNVLDTEMFGAVQLGEIVYGAKIDAVIKDGKHIKAIDHKTSSRMDSRFFDMWRMSTQMRGYFYVLKSLFPEARSLILNVAHIVKNPTFHRDELLWSKANLTDWFRTCINTHQQIKADETTQIWEQRTESCITKYGACPYLDLCLERKDFKKVVPLKAEYDFKKWEPFEDELKERKDENKN